MMSEKLDRLLELDRVDKGDFDALTPKGINDYNDLKAEIINDLEKVYACGNLVSQVNDLLIENEQLKLNFDACCRANRAMSGESGTLREEIKQLENDNGNNGTTIASQDIKIKSLEKKLNDTILERNALDANYDRRVKDIDNLKQKLAVYTEPFKLRPTYQILEKKLDKVNELIESPSDYFMKRGSNSIYDFDKCWKELKHILKDNT